MKFKGYRRKDGRAGVRNHLLVLPTVVCANRVALRIAEMVPKAAIITHPYGCTYDLEESRRIDRVFVGFGQNPNVGAVILVSLGCETTDSHRIASRIAETGKPVELIEIQKDGGSRRASDKGVRMAEKLRSFLGKDRREECDLSELIVATECGGSDALSGLSANPAVGVASDSIVEAGGTVILSETSEIVGAEGILARRAVNERAKEDLLRIVGNAEKGLALTSPQADGVYITPGNIEGGLTTIEEKSLGCIRKAGTSPVVEVVEYAQRPQRRGLVVMDTPGYDVASITGMVAGGAQLVMFTTGRGTPTGCPIAPVIKVSSNTTTYNKMKDDIDLNAGTIIDGRESIQEVGRRIFDMVVDVASGRRTKSERWRYQEFAIAPTSVIEQMWHRQRK